MGDIDGAFERIQHEVLVGFKQTGLALAHHEAGREDESDAALQALLQQKTGGWYYQVAMIRDSKISSNASAFDCTNAATGVSDRDCEG